MTAETWRVVLVGGEVLDVTVRLDASVRYVRWIASYGEDWGGVGDGPRNAVLELCSWGLDAAEIRGPGDLTTAEQLADLAISEARQALAEAEQEYRDAVREENSQKPPPGPCDCCERHDQYNGFGSDGPLLFLCPKPGGCACHD